MGIENFAGALRPLRQKIHKTPDSLFVFYENCNPSTQIITELFLWIFGCGAAHAQCALSRSIKVLGVFIHNLN